MSSMTRYHRPEDLAEALDVLGRARGGARVLVGGTDLLVGLRHRTVVPEVLVDLKGVRDVPAPLEIHDGGIRIGPTATMAAIARDPRVQEWFPALVEAALTVGSVAIRNRASLIGNLCNASPACDTAPTLLVLDARVTIASPAGGHSVPLRDFFLGPRSTLCGSDAIVVRLDVPRPVDGSGSAFRRLTRRRGVDLASVSVAASVDPTGRTVLGLGAVGPRPLVAQPAGPVDVADEAALAHALDGALAVATPISDVRASEEYRRAMLRVLARRAVLAAAARRHDGGRVHRDRA
jgi:carbon-monoxide dehydrogenase medium subunit